MASRMSHYCAQLAIAASALCCNVGFAEFNPEFVPDRSVAAMNGPFQFTIEHSDKFQWMFNPKYTNDICAFDALSLDVGFGTQVFRSSATWGHAISDTFFAKVTGEYFAEDPDFEFTSGSIDRWYGQWGVGADFRYRPLTRRGIHSVHFAFQYLNSQSEDLPNLPNPISNGGGTNIRRVSGTQEMGADLGVRVQPWQTGVFDFDLYYDSMDYARVNEPTNGASGIGFGMAINQNINDCFVVTLSGTDRRPYYEYYARFKWIPTSTIGSLFEIALQFTSDGGAGVFGKEERVALSLFYSWGGDSYATPRNYHDPYYRGLRQDLVEYTAVPVVRPPQIFEQIDQTTIQP